MCWRRSRSQTASARNPAEGKAIATTPSSWYAPNANPPAEEQPITRQPGPKVSRNCPVSGASAAPSAENTRISAGDTPASRAAISPCAVAGPPGTDRTRGRIRGPGRSRSAAMGFFLPEASA